MNAKVVSETQDTIEFYISSHIGANTCQIEGYAEWVGDFFIYKDGENCNVKFIYNKTSSNIEVTSNNCESYCGLNAYFDGKYKKSPEFLVDIGIFNSVQSLKFREITGEHYEDIIGNMQVIYGPKYDQESRLNVVTGNVRGMFTIMESIIIFDNDRNIWTAYIDGDRVNYFTNKYEWVTNIPEPFHGWSERFKEKILVYKRRS